MPIPQIVWPFIAHRVFVFGLMVRVVQPRHRVWRNAKQIVRVGKWQE